MYYYMRTIHLLHIGKTGGSTIKSTLQRYHMKLKNGLFLVETSGHDKKLGSSPGEYAFFVRDPVRRFVSGFISRLREDRPLYYDKHSTIESWAFRIFKTPNQLAEALSSEDADLKFSAIKAINNIKHTKWDIHYYLVSKENVLHHLDKIMFVGRTECLDNDFQKFLGMMQMPKLILLKDDKSTHKTPKKYSEMKKLSSLAVKNLLEWYKSDYEIINVLIEKKLLPEEYKKMLTKEGDYKEDMRG
jgi:hypothetical protein